MEFCKNIRRQDQQKPCRTYGLPVEQLLFVFFIFIQVFFLLSSVPDSELLYRSIVNQDSRLWGILV